MLVHAGAATTSDSAYLLVDASVKAVGRVILYEYPCNERIRSLLRVEHLFDRLFFFAKGEDVRCHQISMATLFELLEISERTDLRGAIVQDLERQRASLSGLRQHPGVDEKRLDAMLEEIAAVAGELGAQGRVGQNLRDNEWLASLRGRLAVPGGSSPVDMPSFHAWQLKTFEERSRDIKTWVEPFMPLYRGMALILRMLRESGDVRDMVAPDGAYQEMLGGKTYQLLRVWVDGSLRVFPEISANKYVIWVRFAMQGEDLKPQPVGIDTPFRLACCHV